MKILFTVCWAFGFIFAATLYFSIFDNMSEDELVTYSFVWIPLVIFGRVGLRQMSRQSPEFSPREANRRAVLVALKWAMIALAILVAFYATLWQSHLF